MDKKCMDHSSLQNNSLIVEPIVEPIYTDFMPSKWLDHFTNRFDSLRIHLNDTVLHLDGLFSDAHTLMKRNEMISHNNYSDRRPICHCVYMNVPTNWMESSPFQFGIGTEIIFSILLNYLKFRTISKPSTTYSTFEFLSCFGKMKFLVLHQCLFIGWHFPTNWTYFG